MNKVGNIYEESTYLDSFLVWYMPKTFEILAFILNIINGASGNLHTDKHEQIFLNLRTSIIKAVYVFQNSFLNHFF